LPSAANFVFARHETLGGAELAAALRKHGVIIRHFARPERIADFVRITVGTEEQNQALLEAFDSECG
jgi:histidinol-phosphate aminotransferase